MSEVSEEFKRWLDTLDERTFRNYCLDMATLNNIYINKWLSKEILEGER